MSIKFETINGQLCRMVEPEPLMLEATFPCLVVMVQRDKYGRITMPREIMTIVTGVSKCRILCDGKVLDSNYWHYSWFEIIGYPVVEGSEDWALYQMMQGKIVCAAFGKGKYFYKDDRVFIENRSYDPMLWISLQKDIGVTWRIHEPEPKESPIDPIERPLRSLILRAKEEGKNIRTYYQDMVFTPCALDGLLADGKFRWWNISNWELTSREQNYYPQLYEIDEPKHESENIHGHIPADMHLKYFHLYELKVGDWVETNDGIHGVVVEPNNNVIMNIRTTNHRAYQVGRETSNIIRKLDPSEVKVKITLEGPVTKPADNAGGRFWLYYSTDEYVSIDIAALCPKDRELVESLLKAQEEK